MEKALVLVTPFPTRFSRAFLDEVEERLGGFSCEEHPERVLKANTPMFQSWVRQPGEPVQDAWELAVTADRWAYGDQKVLLAVCPECAAKTYTFQNVIVERYDSNNAQHAQAYHDMALVEVLLEGAIGLHLVKIEGQRFHAFTYANADGTWFVHAFNVSRFRPTAPTMEEAVSNILRLVA